MRSTNDFANGRFVLDERYEDGHSAIEARLVERLGDIGRKVHTGRSRNDQILVATRLWLKARLGDARSMRVARSRRCASIAPRGEALPLPGYTHLQRAVVSSTALWFAGFAEAFIDDAVRARDTLAWIDANPLGTAAGYGVNLPLDRDHATAALGFARMQINPVYAQLSRGKFEIGALDALGAALLDLRRLAWDLSLFTTAEFGFVHLPAEYTTGSSIMPNKRNPDVVELMRASYASVAAARTEIEQLLVAAVGLSARSAVRQGRDRARFWARACGARAAARSAGAYRLECRAHARRDRAVDVCDRRGDRSGRARRAVSRRVSKCSRRGGSAGEGRTPEASLAARVSPGAAGDLGSMRCASGSRLDVAPAASFRRRPESRCF